MKLLDILKESNLEIDELAVPKLKGKIKGKTKAKSTAVTEPAGSAAVKTDKAKSTAITEPAAKTTVKTAEEKITKIALALDTEIDNVKIALTKDLQRLNDELAKAIQKDIDRGFVGNGEALGKNAKEASKMIAAKEIYGANKALTKEEQTKIIERIKSNSKQMAREAELTAGKSLGTTGGGTTSDGIISKLKKRKISVKTALLSLLGLGVGGYYAYKMISDSGADMGDVKLPKKSDGFPPCVAELIDSYKARLYVENDKTYAFIKTEKYPDGLRFYVDGTVINQRTGKTVQYKCK